MTKFETEIGRRSADEDESSADLMLQYAEQAELAGKTRLADAFRGLARADVARAKLKRNGMYYPK